MGFFEGGVPIEGVNLRWDDTKILPDGTRSLFGILDAQRLDTGIFLKLKITFGEKEPRQKMVVDLTSRAYVQGEFEFQAQITATGPQAAQEALRRKRAEGPRDLSQDLPPSYTSGYQVLQTRELVRDQKGGPYRIINAKILPDEAEVRIVALVPHRDASQPMRMALMPSKDKFGKPQFLGIYLGEAKPIPAPVVTPPRQSPSPSVERTETRSQDKRDNEYERIYGTKLISPTPEKLAEMGTLTDNDIVRCIFRARRTATGEEIRVYANVPGANPYRDLLFKLERTKEDRVVEYHGKILLPEIPEASARQSRAAQVPTPEPVPEASGPAQKKPYQGRLMRITGKPGAGHKEIFPRLDGTTDYFLIYRATDIDTGIIHRVKIFSKDSEVGTLRRLILEPASDHYGPFLRQTSEDLPEELQGVDFSEDEWTRRRVTGIKKVTPDPEDNLEEHFHIFDVQLEDSDVIMKIHGQVPGGDPLRKMSLLTKRKSWRNGELQYEGALIEPDPNVSPEVMESMIERMEPPGLGNVLIRRIVQTFGMESLHVIRYAPDRLIAVDGIGPGTIQAIKEADHLDVKGQIISAMNRARLHLRYFKGVLEVFGSAAVSVIEDRPYELLRVPGLPFKIVDAVAVKSQGRSDLSEERIRAVLGVVIEGLIRGGKSGEQITRIYTLAGELVQEVGCSDLVQLTDKLKHLMGEETDRDDGLVSVSKENGLQMVYFREVVDAERRIAEDLVRRLRSGPDWNPFEPSDFIRRYEEVEDKRLGREQAEAVAMACQNGVSVMTGGPGVGKTTTLDATIKALESVGVTVLSLAPTGIASKRMRAATGSDAITVHSAIGRLDREREDDPFIDPDDPTCVVIDETSMVNIDTLHKFLMRLPDHVRILFSGDVDQLPSIGPGQILKDLIASGIFPVTRLTEVFRQDHTSGIVPAAMAINNQRFPKEAKDFRIIRLREPDQIADEVIYQQEQIIKAGRFDPLSDVMVLPSVKKSSAGVRALNVRLQNLLNPPSPAKPEMILSRPSDEETEKTQVEIMRVGDKVMQTRNDGSRGLVNGDIGRITAVDPQLEILWVKFDEDRDPVIIEKENLNYIRHAYAMTVHKSQGSESDVVIVPLNPNFTSMLFKNLLYTAVTRAKKEVILIGDDATINKCLNRTMDNNLDLIRYSTLSRHCQAVAIELPEFELEVDLEPEPF